jgi:glycosyltransferase involved in cell wall biosynthesis
VSSNLRAVFHHPHALEPGGARASVVRPFRMLEAFQSLGYEVDCVTGTARERAQAMRTVEQRLQAGAQYAFLYAESSTEPTLLTEPHHLPLHPLLDFSFMARLKAKGVPLGLFYRDVYWRFPSYGLSLPAWKRWGAQAMYRYDLWQYRRLLDHLYLPALAMAPYLPWPLNAQVSALPPGHVPARAPAPRQGPGLNLLYVGGLGQHYQLHALFEAVNQVPGVNLTVCTRVAEWQAVGAQYPMGTDARIQVVHASGDALQALYAQADVCMLAVKPSPYWQFAAPVKLFEYIGMERPIVASQDTLPGRLVQELGVGWTVPYEVEPLRGLLQRLSASAAERLACQAQTRRVAARHTWQARAQQVVADLAPLSRALAVRP